MANFQETRFLGLTPRAIGLTVVAAAIVVGLFFIPEGIKLLFDAKPKSSKPQAAAVHASRQEVVRRGGDSEPRAGLSRDALSAINSDMAGKKVASSEPAGDAPRPTKRAPESEESTGASKGGIFSGWDFSVKARPSSGPKVDAPATLSIEKIVSRDGISFLKQGRGAIPRFLKQEGLLGGPGEEAIRPLQQEINAVVSGGGKAAPGQEVANQLRSAHLDSLQGLRAAGADRGVMLRWLEVPVVRFIDTQGGVNAARRIRENFDPGLILRDLSVKQRRQRGWGVSGRAPTNFRAEFTVAGSDVQKVVAYSNGKVVRSIKLSRVQSGEPRLVRINGDASGVWTLVAYDSFGARPYSKSYSFYPKASVFRQGRDGSFQIGFLPGSGRNSLDRFFLVGASTRRQPSDSVISTF
jgi:hypothetical protein